MMKTLYNHKKRVSSWNYPFFGQSFLLISTFLLFLGTNCTLGQTITPNDQDNTQNWGTTSIWVKPDHAQWRSNNNNESLPPSVKIIVVQQQANTPCEGSSIVENINENPPLTKASNERCGDGNQCMLKIHNAIEIIPITRTTTIQSGYWSSNFTLDQYWAKVKIPNCNNNNSLDLLAIKDCLFDLNNISRIEIYNFVGKKVLVYRGIESLIDFSNQPDGTYYLIAYSEDNKIIEKFSISRQPIISLYTYNSKY